MAAIVRSGARRLAGSAMLQRAQAAGSLIQPKPKPKPAAGSLIQRTPAPCLARFMSSTKQHAGASSKAVEEIQEVKEELYDMISVTENSVHTNAQNRWLLMSLSAQIKPRPDDPQWCLVRASKRKSHVIRTVGTVSGLCLGLVSVFVLKALEGLSQSYIKERQEADAAKDKEVPLV